MDFSRGSGILLHITSLPGPYGIGTLGRSALEFIDFLADAGQRYWQILPSGPTSGFLGHSPYMNFSAFAGNPLIICLDWLEEKGWLDKDHLLRAEEFSEYFVEFDKVVAFHYSMLELAFQGFCRQHISYAYGEFLQREGYWLNDYALFMAFREESGGLPWNRWPHSIAKGDPAAMVAAHLRLSDRIAFHQFVQYCFDLQWDEMKNHAGERGVLLIGDMPIYVGFDSVDVWANQGNYRLDYSCLEPTHVAGVPPDYFSETGQRWGNPLYRWTLAEEEMTTPLYGWWEKRFLRMLGQVDVCRIDHFRGFESYWEIPAEEETAMNGEWVKGPGSFFFEWMRRQLGELPIIAEDLGIITKEVTALRRKLGFPGMKILQFAFESDETNDYLPHNFHSENCVVYTGTHDNNTTLGWFMGETLTASVRERICRYLQSDGHQVSRQMIRLALSSVAKVALFPMQDLLGFGEDCRMNTPGTSEGNWQWRCAGRFFDSEVKDWLRGETEFYNRLKPSKTITVA
ncbi:MAG: 4-alpha-glucanotransferase [Proteobacteria bacterium]|nr:4-alpha-glucanotransferase [Pseudomonadota bacterium]MBU1688625.1 4-alpha-glucanotransferase [Pseudomonadota bacterium]